ncbi:hypothetical protein GUA46_13330 [Muricauda sp. HICW]|uniref:SGNH/GDSL hydrolase family protein n=1 Tax=Flagellimonas chongwuensis TaxID=2697365 RepID=A0A850NLR4_9FLAO|nr:MULTISPECIES: hypothetical protein [Allomuricauda]NVN19325.1 hypothetical protein [Allomuricauda chongwuensis]
MKKFLKVLTIFFMPILVITLGLEFYLRSYESDYAQKLEGLNLKKDNIQVLILGNSHAFNDVAPDIIEKKAFNLAGLNQSIYYDKRITLKYLDDLPQLQYVLISMDYHSLYFSSQGIRDVWSYYSYGIPYEDSSYFKERLSYFWFGYTPRITFSLLKTKLLDRIKNVKDIRLINGWEPLLEMEHGAFKESTINARAKYFNDLVHGSVEREMVQSDLESFIQKLKDKGINPILFTPPVQRRLTDRLDQEIMQKNAEYIQQLQTTYDVPYWNLINAISDESLYYNVDHLNSSGAKEFSQILNEKLEDYIFEKSNYDELPR